jgi:hypothetical protein
MGNVMTVFAAENGLWAGATVRPEALRVPFAKKLVGGGGPSIDTDGELGADAEPVAFFHCGMAPGNAGVRRLARR